MRKTVVWMLMMLMMINAAVAEGMMIVTGGTLRMRTEPDFNAEVIGRYDEGTVVSAVAEIDGWYAVTAPDGRSGYMYGTYLKDAGDTSETSMCVVSENGGNVNLRSAPDKNAAVIAKVPVGTEATVISMSGEWRYITLADGRSGYMMARYLACEESGVRYVTSVNGGGVHMRTGPSQEYRSLGVLHVGTQVTLLEAGSTWHRILYDGHEGYMMARYLTAAEPAARMTLRSIRLNDMTPDVGQVLKVTVNPSDAQCLIIWTDDAGRLLGTGRQYCIVQDDAGQRIFAAGIGFGGTEGAVVSDATSPVSR